MSSKAEIVQDEEVVLREYTWRKGVYSLEACTDPDTFTIYLANDVLAKIALAYHIVDNKWYGDVTWSIGASNAALELEVTRSKFGGEKSFNTIAKNLIYQCWDIIKWQAERQSIDTASGDLLKLRQIVSYLMAQSVPDIQCLHGALRDYDDESAAAYTQVEPVDPNDGKETLGEYFLKQSELSTVTNNAIDPGIYHCNKAYTNELGYKFKKGTSCYVWEWFEEQDFCICSFGAADNRIHIAGATIRDNWKRVADLPNPIAEPKLVTISIKNKNPDSKPFNLLPVEIAEKVKPIIEQVDGLQQIAMFEKQEVKIKPVKPKGYYGYIGKDKTDNQRFKRKVEGFKAKLNALPAAERNAILLALSEMRNTNTSTPPRNKQK